MLRVNMKKQKKWTNRQILQVLMAKERETLPRRFVACEIKVEEEYSLSSGSSRHGDYEPASPGQITFKCGKCGYCVEAHDSPYREASIKYCFVQ